MGPSASPRFIFMSSGELKVTAASAGANKKQYISKCETGGSVIKVGFGNCISPFYWMAQSLVRNCNGAAV